MDPCRAPDGPVFLPHGFTVVTRPPYANTWFVATLVALNQDQYAPECGGDGRRSDGSTTRTPLDVGRCGYDLGSCG